MKLQVMAVYDSKARAFLTPFFVAHIDVGVRAFADNANNPEALMAKNPEDFSLFHLGSWNDDDSAFVLLQAPQNFGLAAQFKR